MLNEFEGHLREAFVPPRMVSGGRIVSAIFRYWEEMPDTYPADVRGFLFLNFLSLNLLKSISLFIFVLTFYL